MSAASDLETLRDSASASIASGDYATALATVERMAVILAGTPDQTLPSGVRLEWDRRIQSLLGLLNQRQASASGIQRTKTVWAQPSEAT